MTLKTAKFCLLFLIASTFITLIPPIKAPNGETNHWLDRFTYDIFDGVTHTTTFFINPQVFWNGSGWQALNFEDHYSTNGYYLIQNAHITAKIYEWYSVFLDPDNQRVCVDDERWIVEVWNKKRGKWREVDLYNPTLSYSNNETHLSVTRSFDTYEGLFNITYIVSQGLRLKHDVLFKSKTENENEFRVTMKLTGIYHNKVYHIEGIETITSEKHIISPYFFIGENTSNLVLSEYLFSLGFINETSGEWISTTLKDIIFNTHAKGCKVDIIIGNYTLGENEFLLIDPDTSTITPPTKDTWIAEYHPDTNYGWYAFFIVKSYMVFPDGANRRTLIEFVISEISEGAIISSANLRLKVLSAGASGRTYQFRRINSSWNELGVTWNNQPSINETNGEDYPSPSSTGWTQYSLTDMVQDARDEGTTFGVRIKDASENSKVTAYETRYYGKDGSPSPPELVVIWEVPDTTKPTFSNVGTNTTLEGEQCLFHVKWIDNIAMHGYIFGWNDSGAFQNNSWVEWSPTGTPKWANVTNRLTRIAETTIQWEVWANDTSNNWNNTGLQSFVITSDPFNFALGIAAGALLASIIVGIIAYAVASDRKR